MSIRVLEFDKIFDMPFDTFLRVAMAPMNALGCELDLPLSKLLSTSNVETDVTQNPVPAPCMRRYDADTDPASHR